MNYAVTVTRLAALLPKKIACSVSGNRDWLWEYRFNAVFRRSRILSNVNNVRHSRGRKRALLVYIVEPFLTRTFSERFVSHTNYWRCRAIASTLGELGYVVDVMGHADYRSTPRSDYDLLFGFGRAEELAQKFPPTTVKIRLATGSEATFHNRREQERAEQVSQRRGCSLQAVRHSPDNSELIRHFDAIACLGNDATAATYRPFFDGRILCFNNHGYDHLMGLPQDKDFRKARRNFLYFAGNGQILNGLDLLLEVFAQKPDLNLYVCGPFRREVAFEQCFHHELYETPNIYPIGWVVVGSSEYLALVRECGTVIVPICSGASHGSVVVCMANGLIPVVTKEAGIDTGDFGITLPSYEIDDIDSAVDWISRQSAAWHEHMSRRVLHAARQDFSQAAFSRRIRNILTRVIELKSGAEHTKATVPAQFVCH
jgi:hypothetical protein